jgi:hypothetical protein
MLRALDVLIAVFLSWGDRFLKDKPMEFCALSSWKEQFGGQICILRFFAILAV